MKTAIHPEYFTDAVITCANCSHQFKTGATQKEQKIEICSQCHPFFTGKKVLIDTEGRVDKFTKKMQGATGRKKKLRKKKTLEERMNAEIADQLEKEAKKEAKKAVKKTSPKAEAPQVEEAPAPETSEAAPEEAAE